VCKPGRAGLKPEHPLYLDHFFQKCFFFSENFTMIKPPDFVFSGIKNLLLDAQEVMP